MTINNIVIARHGFRANWIPSENWNVNDRDPPLAKYGVDQAIELSRHLKQRYNPSSIYSSPFKRCLQTAEPTSREFGLPIKVEPGIQEWFHPILPPPEPPTLHVQPYLTKDLRSQFPTVDEEYKITFLPNRLGETLEDLHDRSRILIDNLIPREEAKGIQGTIIIFTHAATAIALGRALTKDINLEIKTGCASYCVYEKKNNNESDWKIRENGLVNHLPNGEERHWDFSMSTKEFDRGEVGTEFKNQDWWGLTKTDESNGNYCRL